MPIHRAHRKAALAHYGASVAAGDRIVEIARRIEARKRTILANLRW